MMSRWWSASGRLPMALMIVFTAASALTACSGNQGRPGRVYDEAYRAKRTPQSFPAADEDYFHDMDGAQSFTRDEIQGRNMWLVWTGGNDRFWDSISETSLGTLDFLKTLSSHPSMKYGRNSRWTYLGLVNEPCYKQATGPDPNRYGLWLDVRDPGCPPDPFANTTKYAGVAIGSRGKTVAVGSYYGEPSGIVGLRLFPNPDFDENARRRWDSERYYRDPTYYLSKDLVKPYRVGMSCAFCHVGPNPVRPPADPENPKWENLSSNVGAQYFWVDRIFNWQGDENRRSFFYQLFHTSRPGSLDTSLVSTDNINNPRTMNAVYQLGPRLGLARQYGRELLTGGGVNNKQFNDFVGNNDPLSQFFQAPNVTFTPRVLKDGSDSVGALGALNRVYLNIGLFSEEWLLHFRPLVGGTAISPIEVAVARKNSVYWDATELQTPNMARFFLRSTAPHHLKDAPDGAAYLTESAATVDRGKTVFAERCARCHSSKIPPIPPDLVKSGLSFNDCNGKDYLACWDAYWNWSTTDSFKTTMTSIVRADDFLDNNYLSTEFRVPSTVMQTNVCSPIATNAIAGNIWDNFSSASYKALPSVGTVKVRHPRTGAESAFVLPGGGRGFTRPASLVSAWSTAPFLQNNTVGPFDPSPSVAARMKVFQASIEQMLWPERRAKDPIFANDSGPGVGVIDRTTADSYIWVPAGFVPDSLRGLLSTGERLFPMFVKNGSVEIGPIPKGTPVSLLANADLLGADLPVNERIAHQRELLNILKIAQHDLKRGVDIFANPQILDELLKLSKCPDFVVNKGHYFGTNLMPDEPALSDDDKRALIAFVKTF
jgi:hypothetical protein